MNAVSVISAAAANSAAAGAIAVSGDAFNFAISKTKNVQASFAWMTAYGSKNAREDGKNAMHAVWLTNGNFRPLVLDICASGIVPEAATHHAPAVQAIHAGRLPKRDEFVSFCRGIVAAHAAAVAKAALKDKTVKLNAQKEYCLRVCNGVVAQADEAARAADEAARAEGQPTDTIEGETREVSGADDTLSA